MLLKIDKTKTILSNHAIYKTEKMAFLILPLVDADSVLLKIAESVIKWRFFANAQNGKVKYQVKLTNEKIYLEIDNEKNKIVFYDFEYPDAFIKKGDTRLKNLSEFDVSEISIITRADPSAASSISSEFAQDDNSSTNYQSTKLYRIIQTKNYFPILDENQKQIVTTEDKNMIVHGVAGSGKTNVCIDKIIYSAGRGYRGRLLYTTFSKSLLNETKLKILEYTNVLKEFLTADLEFLCDDKAGAVEIRLGVYLSLDEDNPLVSLRKIVQFLENQVDYYLIEEIFYKAEILNKIQDDKVNSCHPERSEVFCHKIANETYFINEYLPQIKNHNLSARLKQINHISQEVVYKEIYGMILGSENVLSESEYVERRGGSFSRTDCQTIFALSKDYQLHLRQNGLTDYNQMCRDMIDKAEIAAARSIKLKYSLVLIDEVQDMTQINLAFFKSISLKMFCVGDALQMINPSYFSFAYLKRLLYEKDVSFVKELVSNYRSSQKIAELLKDLSELNSKSFGVHNFVLFSSSAATAENTETVFVEGRHCERTEAIQKDREKNKSQDYLASNASCNDRQNEFLDILNNSSFNNYTIITPTQKIKDTLKQKFTKQEILTVSESKGLERETVILYDILSAQKNEWHSFIKKGVDRKTADENSVYRYYFNLLYVAVSRAKQKLYVIENAPPIIFGHFFSSRFDSLTSDKAYDKLLAGADKLEAEQDEVVNRCREFIKLGQYENALFWAEQIVIPKDKEEEIIRIEVAKAGDYTSSSYRAGGIRFMKEGMYEDALEYFMLAGEESLANLARSCMGIGEDGGGMEAIRCFADLEGNEEAREVVLEILREDFYRLRGEIVSKK